MDVVRTAILGTGRDVGSRMGIEAAMPPLQQTLPAPRSRCLLYRAIPGTVQSWSRSGTAAACWWGVVVGRAEATPIRSDRDLAALYYLFCWGCVASCGGVRLCVYGRDWKPQPEGVKKKKKLACHRVVKYYHVRRTDQWCPSPLQLLACVERQAARAFKAEPGSAYSSLLLRTATTALLRGPPPARTAPFIVSSDGDQIHLILDRSGSEGKKAPPYGAPPPLCSLRLARLFCGLRELKTNAKGQRSPTGFRLLKLVRGQVFAFGFCRAMLRRRLSALSSPSAPRPRRLGASQHRLAAVSPAVKPSLPRYVSPHVGCIIIKKR
jgi:hypothetical protein